MMIWTPFASSCPWVNSRATPSAPRTITDCFDASTASTSALRTSVTTTGLIVVVVVTVAVPFIPGFSSDTDTFLPSTVKRKSSGTVYSCVPF